MKKATVVAVLACLGGMSAVARAGTELSWSADAAVMSKYVWRGAVLTDGPVLQPGVNLGVSGIGAGAGEASFSIWANMDLDDVNGNAAEVNEVDFTLGYGFKAGPDGKAGVSLGVMRYEYPNTGSDGTTEVFAGASFDVPGSPSVTLYKDIDAVEGLYVSLAGSCTYKEQLDLGFSLGLGDDDHNAGNYGAGGGLTDFALTVACSVPGMPEKQSLGVSLALTALIGDVADAVELGGGDPSNVVLGIAYSAKF